MWSIYFIYFCFACKGKCDFTLLQTKIWLNFNFSCILWTNDIVKCRICYEIFPITESWIKCKDNLICLWTYTLALKGDMIYNSLRYWCETDLRRVYNVRCSRAVYRSLILEMKLSTSRAVCELCFLLPWLHFYVAVHLETIAYLEVKLFKIRSFEIC